MSQDQGTAWAGKCPVCKQWIVLSISTGPSPGLDHNVARMVLHQFQGRDCDGTGQQPVEISPSSVFVKLKIGDVVPNG